MLYTTWAATVEMGKQWQVLPLSGSPERMVLSHCAGSASLSTRTENDSLVADVFKETPSRGAHQSDGIPVRGTSKEADEECLPWASTHSLRERRLHQDMPRLALEETLSYRFPVKDQLEKPQRVWFLRPSKGFPG